MLILCNDFKPTLVSVSSVVAVAVPGVAAVDAAAAAAAATPPPPPPAADIDVFFLISVLAVAFTVVVAVEPAGVITIVIC